jgi:D-3-phosphoglycerate dehydrogenase
MKTAESIGTVDTLVLDLLEWMGTGPRPYDDVMDAWRTSCPRLTVWEEATAQGYVERHSDPGLGRVVTVTARGAAHLNRHRPTV